MIARLKQVVRGFFSLWPMSTRVCWHGRRNSGMVALTFDDGPDPVFTKPLLEALAHAEVQATFFVLGERAEKHPELIELISDGGHEIGIHGFDHSASDIRQQFARCAEVLAKLNVAPRWLRLPGTHRYPAASVIRLAFNTGGLVYWSYDAHDSMRHEGKWHGRAPDYNEVRGGDIVLMHDDNPVCLRDLPLLLKSLHIKGLQPVSVSELLG